VKRAAVLVLVALAACRSEASKDDDVRGVEPAASAQVSSSAEVGVTEADYEEQVEASVDGADLEGEIGRLEGEVGSP
jgi:hypothetical protein